MIPNGGIPETEIKPLKEILDVGLYDPVLKGELVKCRDWEYSQTLQFLENLPAEHDLYLPVGFIETIEKDPYQLYCDTDSVVGTSKLLYLDNNILIENTIENIWEGLKSVEINEYKESKESKDIFDLDLRTPTISKYGEDIQYKKIKKIVRHKITKKLYRVKTDNNEVIITEDHSLIVLRDNELVGITIKELRDGDRLLEISNSFELYVKIIENFTIEELSEEEASQYEYVYDIEVEDNPVFFANNILVHNSDYLLIKLTFDKNQDHRKTVDYCQKLTIRMNEAYIAALDLYFYKLAGWHPDFNTMDFKSEVVAFRGFFCTKKFYALGKVWDEGKFLGKLETKKTGGQLRKADVTKVTKEMLSEVYELLTVDQSITDVVTIYNKIFVEIKNKYIFKLKEAIKNLQFEYFTVPKKWSFGEKKSIPPQINGARLYNRIIKDTFSMGDAVLVLPIKYNMPRMKKEFELRQANENMLQNHELTVKIKDISLPPAKKMTEKDKEYIISRFEELEIKPDFDEIMNFNIDMKLEPFKKLFSLEVTRKAKALSESNEYSRGVNVSL